MSDFNHLQQILDKLADQDMLRSPTTIDSAQGPTVIIDNREFVLFSSNNYLSLANHPGIIKAVKSTLDEFGFASAASRLISGTMTPHTQLEQRVAKICNKQSALIFPSGWTANEAVIKSIPQKGDLLILDKLNHASIIDAAQASDADFRTYRRENPEKLGKLLADKNYDKKFIITESIFSMDGDTADLKRLVELKEKYGAYLIVDEAHAFGCIGPNSAGLADEFGLMDKIDIIIATFGKALAANGAAVISEKSVIDYLINKARAFIYTTAPSPVICAAVNAALDLIEAKPERKEKLKRNADYLRSKLQQIGVNTGNSTTHIVPAIIGPADKTLELSKELYDAGFFIPAIRPPTVAPETSRLRISLQSGHTVEQMDSLLETTKKCILS